MPDPKVSYAERLKAAHEAAVALPWVCREGQEGEWAVDADVTRRSFTPIAELGQDQSIHPDGQLIVLLRNAAPEIIAVLEAAREVELMDEASEGDGVMMEPSVATLRATLDALDAKVAE